MDREEYEDWQRYWEVEPWGELRADERAAVTAAYHLSPYLPAGSELPRLQYPYWPDPAEAAAAIAAAEEARRQQEAADAAWETKRRQRAEARRRRGKPTDG